MKIYLVKSTSKEKIKLANTKQQQQQQQDQANKQMKKHPLKWWGDHFSCMIRRPHLTVITNRTELFRSTIIYQNHYDRLQFFLFFSILSGWEKEKKMKITFFLLSFLKCVFTRCVCDPYMVHWTQSIGNRK